MSPKSAVIDYVSHSSPGGATEGEGGPGMIGEYEELGEASDERNPGTRRR